MLERLRAGATAKSWEQFDDLYRPFLLGMFRSRCAAADAEDLVQDVLRAVVSALPQFVHNGRPGAFRRWLRTIAVHRLLALKKEQRLRDAVSLDALAHEIADPQSALSRQWEQDHDRSVLAGALQRVQGQVEPQTWLAFQCKEIDGLSTAESAARAAMTPNAVYVAVSRVRKRLREELRDLVDF
jgi:RNA polymerase sigma-70 factor (ECF subfamily)